MKFPKFSHKHDDKELIKVRSSKGSVLVSNDQILEYAYNQCVEGERSVDIVTPDGQTHTRTFVQVDKDRANRIRGNRHNPRTIDRMKHESLYVPKSKKEES